MRRSTSAGAVGILAVATLLIGVLSSITTAPAGADGNESPIDSFASRSLSLGSRSSCAIVAGGAVKCWGANDFGQLGLGDTNDRGDGPGEMGDNLPAVNLGAGHTATALAAGLHTCALLDDATVKCWGLNDTGQLGLGDTNIRGDGPAEMGDNLPTVSLGTGRTATAIAAGFGHTCALLDNGTVKCWGLNDSGQLGLGNTANRGDGANEMGDNLPPVNLGTGRTATAITAGSSYTCALLDNATVKCWGANDGGELGLGDTNNRGDTNNEMGDNLPPVNLGTGRTATAVTAGESHTCARLDNAAIKCWGSNGSGQLGRGTTSTVGEFSGQMGDNLAAVDLGGNRAVTLVAAGLSHSCALLESGAVKCWGINASGQLGQGDTFPRGAASFSMGNDLPAINLGTGRTATAVASSPSSDFTCALLDNATVKCWGANTSGQLGLGDIQARGDAPNEMGDNLPAVNLGTGRTALSIAVGGSHACARLDNATVKCWGANTNGQLGLGDVQARGDGANEMGDNLPSVDLGTGRTATAITAGAGFTCARLDNGTVKCWGLNDFGQLGRGNTDSRGGSANQMGDNLAAISLGTGRTAVAISAGAAHVCARLDNATVKCWGANTNGQLGLGDVLARGDGANEMGDSLPTVLLGTGRSARALSAGGAFTCARLDNATTKCWGRNDVGQLGQGDTVQRGDAAIEMGDALPTANLGTNRTATTLAAGGAHSCARLDDLTVKCWGFNSTGQLGLGDTNHRGDAGGEMGDALGVATMGNNAPSGITGRLGTTGTGESIGGAYVLVMRPSDFSIVGAALTNGRGEFTAYTPAGSYLLYLVDPQGNHTAAFHGAPGATVVTVASDAMAVANPTAATARGRVAGTVTEDTSNLALANQVVISLGGPNTSVETATTTNAAGGYTLRGLANGTHWIGFLDPTGAHRAEFFPNSTDVSHATAVVTSTGVTAAASASLAVQASTGTGATITGTVTEAGSGAPLGGAMVVALNAADFRMALVAFADPVGHYSLDLQPGNTFKLAFVDPTDRHAMEWHVNQPNTGLANATSVAAPGLANADLVLSGGTISGTVTDATTANPVPGTIVLAIGPSGPAGATTARTDGSYAVANLAPGTYRVAFIDPSGVRAVEFWLNSADFAGATPINVTANATTANISPQLNRS